MCILYALLVGAWGEAWPAARASRRLVLSLLCSLTLQLFSGWYRKEHTVSLRLYECYQMICSSFCWARENYLQKEKEVSGCTKSS